MPIRNTKPSSLAQNRLGELWASRSRRIELYREILERRAEEAEAGRGGFKIPRLRGLRMRLPGKPFHPWPEFFFQEGGATRFELPSQTISSVPGEAVLIPIGMPHGESWRGLDFLNLIVMFQATTFSCHLGCLADGRGPLKQSPVDRFASEHRLATLRYAEELAAAGPDPVADRLRRGLYLALLSRLLEGIARGAEPGRPRQHLLLDRCLEFIDIHYTRLDFSVVWLARELGCSADYLSRLFRRSTGCRLIETIHRRRIEQAMRLLQEGDMNIAETAWACGFTQPSYFNRIFREATGLTPLAYRSGAKGASPPVEKVPRNPRVA